MKERIFPTAHLPGYRIPALKRTWTMIGNRATRSISFAPLIPGLRAFVLHLVSPFQFRLLACLPANIARKNLNNAYSPSSR